jgi:hypothetical protein
MLAVVLAVQSDVERLALVVLPPAKVAVWFSNPPSWTE